MNLDCQSSRNSKRKTDGKRRNASNWNDSIQIHALPDGTALQRCHVSYEFIIDGIHQYFWTTPSTYNIWSLIQDAEYVTSTYVSEPASCSCLMNMLLSSERVWVISKLSDSLQCYFEYETKKKGKKERKKKKKKEKKKDFLFSKLEQSRDFLFIALIKREEFLWNAPHINMWYYEAYIKIDFLRVLDFFLVWFSIECQPPFQWLWHGKRVRNGTIRHSFKPDGRERMAVAPMAAMAAGFYPADALFPSSLGDSWPSAPDARIFTVVMQCGGYVNRTNQHLWVCCLIVISRPAFRHV